MERTKKSNTTPTQVDETSTGTQTPVIVDTTVRCEKVGGGFFYLGNRIIKPGERFRADPNDIPEAFRDTIIFLDGDPTFKPKAEVQPKRTIIAAAKHLYSLAPSSDEDGLFDIVDENGKKINEKSVDETTATTLINDLEK